MKKWNLIVMALVLSGASIFSLAAQPNGQRGGRDGFNPERMMERLDMTEDQKTKAEQLHLTAQKEAQNIQNQLGEKAARMRTLMSGGSANENEILDLIEEMGMLEIEMKKSRASTKLAVRDLLTEEQQIKFDQMAMRHGRNGRGHGPRHGQ